MVSEPYEDQKWIWFTSHQCNVTHVDHLLFRTAAEQTVPAWSGWSERLLSAVGSKSEFCQQWTFTKHEQFRTSGIPDLPSKYLSITWKQQVKKLKTQSSVTCNTQKIRRFQIKILSCYTSPVNTNNNTDTFKYNKRNRRKTLQISSVPSPPASWSEVLVRRGVLNRSVSLLPVQEVWIR